jgi:hypothetical protein
MVKVANLSGGKPPLRTFETFILEGLQLLLKASQGAIMMLKVESLKGPEGRFTPAHATTDSSSGVLSIHHSAHTVYHLSYG